MELESSSPYPQVPALRLRDTSSRDTPLRRTEWGSSLPPECFVSRGSISTWVILNILFYGEGLLAPRPTPKLVDHPSSAVRGCLFTLFTATLHIGGHFSIRNLRTRHAVVTGTHIHGGVVIPVIEKIIIITIMQDPFLSDNYLCLLLPPFHRAFGRYFERATLIRPAS
jgi:hypothetical protein